VDIYSIANVCTDGLVEDGKLIPWQMTQLIVPVKKIDLRRDGDGERDKRAVHCVEKTCGLLVTGETLCSLMILNQLLQ
jgi:hypothetical protein